MTVSVAEWGRRLTDAIRASLEAGDGAGARRLVLEDCPIWNGVATIRGFGRPHWVFEDAARPDGSCTMHVYKRRDGAPPEFAVRLATAPGGE